VKIEEEKGKGGMGLMVGYYLYLGLRTRQLCLTDPAWDNSPGGLRKILSQRYFLFLFFPHNCTHMYRAQKCNIQ